MIQLSNKELLESVVERSLAELCEDFKKTDQGSGWHQYFRSSKVGIVATSQALMLLDLYGITDPIYSTAIDFIVNSQFDGLDPKMRGGWAYVSNITEQPNTECTCWALLSLHTVSKGNNVTTILSGIEWLKRNFISSGANKGWTSFEGNGFRTYATCMALKTLFTLGESDSIEFSQALTTIKRNQRIDGGWAETAEGSSMLAHTSHSVLTLLHCGVSRKSTIILNAIKWIYAVLNKQLFEGEKAMGYVEIFDLSIKSENKDRSQRMTFYHSPLVYALQALIEAGAPHQDLIYSITSRLLSENRDGHWSHPYLPNQTTTWSVFDALTTLQHFKTSKFFEGFETYKYIDPNLPKERFDLLVLTIVPVEFLTLNRLIGFTSDATNPYYSRNGHWFFKYILERPGKSRLSCLITLVGSAGEVDCSLACLTAFSAFQFDTAILCGIAAGLQSEINKYSCVAADTLVAYEFQRLQKDEILYRPQFFNIDSAFKKLTEKVPLVSSEYSRLFDSYLKILNIDEDTIDKFKLRSSKLKSGVVASGSKLLADGTSLEKIIAKIPVDKGIIAFEMEGGGFASACQDQSIRWLVFRGISDYGGTDKNKKNKELQKLAVASAVAGMITFFKQAVLILATDLVTTTHLGQ